MDIWQFFLVTLLRTDTWETLSANIFEKTATYKSFCLFYKRELLISFIIGTLPPAFLFIFVFSIQLTL